MGLGIGTSFIYSPIMIERYLNNLPFWRKILARFFEKYKVTQKEYDEWVIKTIFK